MEILDNKEEKQYESQIDGKLVKIEYIKTSDKIYLTHTEVPESLSGQGIGGKLVEAVLEEVESSDLKLIPLCPFVAKYIKENPDWRRILHHTVSV